MDKGNRKLLARNMGNGMSENEQVKVRWIF